MIRRFLLSLLLCLLIIASRESTTPQSAAAQSGTAYQVIQLVNEFRANHGLPPFQVNSALSAAAQNQANYMAANTIFSSHVGEGGSTPQSRANAAGYVGYVSENIVGGTGMTPNRGLVWWENIPVHYNTLVTSRYIEAGTGYATNGSENFYVLVVGRPSDAPPSNNSPDNSPEALFITPIELSEPGEDGSIVHVVQDGQALWSLAAHYEVSLADLLLYNNLSENSFLQPCDEVMIQLAEGQEPPPSPTPPLCYVVKSGDTAWSIAAAHKVSLADFLWLNGLGEEAILQPGEEVTVRLAEGQAPPPTPTPILTHIIRSGQTLWDVALTYGLSLENLLAYNGLTADAILQVGQELRIVPPVTPTTIPTSTPEIITTPIPPAQIDAKAQSTPTIVLAAVATRPFTPTPVVAEDTAVSSPPTTFTTTSITALAIGLTVLAGVVFLFARREGI